MESVPVSAESVQVICGACVKEAALFYLQRSQTHAAALLRVRCHDVERLVWLPEFSIRRALVLSDNPRRLTFVWDQLADVDHLPDVIDSARSRIDHALSAPLPSGMSEADRRKHIDELRVIVEHAEVVLRFQRNGAP